MDIATVFGVQFQRAGRIYDFSSPQEAYKVGDNVVVDTERGQALGEIVRIRPEGDAQFVQSLKRVIRRASDKDLSKETRWTHDEMLSIVSSRADYYRMKMRPIKAESLFGGSKIVVYFSSTGRIDFRELVKDLAGQFKARVELKQVGARDEAKLLGGLGVCGREYCCSSFLREFVPVSIKMAKNQNLALNPNKVSGGCGRLLCCLTYENDVYTELRSKMPAFGSTVRIVAEGLTGRVLKADLLNQRLLVETQDGKQTSYKLSDLEVLNRAHQNSPDDMPSEAEMWAEDIDLKQLT